MIIISIIDKKFIYNSWHITKIATLSNIILKIDANSDKKEQFLFSKQITKTSLSLLMFKEEYNSKNNQNKTTTDTHCQCASKDSQLCCPADG